MLRAHTQAMPFGGPEGTLVSGYAPNPPLVLHLLLGWGLLNGLAQRMIEVIKAPIETKIIEETKPPPPPPPENLPPPPKFAPPPPSFVPPPEVNVNPPPTPAPTITTTTVGRPGHFERPGLRAHG